MNAAYIAMMLTEFRIRAQHEFELQAGIERILKEAGIAFERECRLSPKDRIDFLVIADVRVGIEVKVDGSIQSVTTQLHRYAKCETVDELVLATTRNKHRGIPTSFNGKPIALAHFPGIF